MVGMRGEMVERKGRGSLRGDGVKEGEKGEKIG